MSVILKDIKTGALPLSELFTFLLCWIAGDLKEPGRPAKKQDIDFCLYE